MSDTERLNPSFLDMSDEEMASFDPTKLVVSNEEKVSTETTETITEESSSDAGEVESTEEVNDDDEEDGVTEDDEVEESATPSVEKEVTNTPETKPSVVENKEVAPQVNKEKPAATESTEVDYKAAYEELFAPFKANGKNIQVTNIAEAKALMQMGANYNKKMGALKPNLKLMKLLDNNGLLDEAKLTYLIDLDKKNPEAITKLLKDSGIDPMGIDTEKASDYKPGNYKVDDRELELDAVVEEIKDSPSYSRTLSIVADEWDQASKRAIGEHPKLLSVINDHVERGIYDVISTEMERQRMLGQLSGFNDIDAYRQVGDAIQARGGFDSLSAKGKVNQQAVVVTPKPKVDDIELKNKKRAASSTKPAVSSGVAKDFNPLALSDEEFSKMVNPSLM